MTINAGDYFDAALSHSHAARALYSGGRFVLAHYVAGLAVECVFRALRARMTLEFDERHDLMELASSSGFLEAVPPRQQGSISLLLGEVTARWLNHRYRSDASLKTIPERAQTRSENQRGLP